jgi:hypothetical protein
MGVTAVLAMLMLLMLELAVGLVLLGTWVSEGRRREEELERLEWILRAQGGSGGGRDGEPPVQA